MHTIAFVGQSGTGKSHRAIKVAQMHDADAIIDDGLLISVVSGTRVLAGTSAKREKTRIASFKRALFMIDKGHILSVKRAIANNNVNRVMILGTSDGMVERIASMLSLPPIEKIIRIEDVATADEIEHAQSTRNNEGKHVIPVPTFEIKKDFSGYFLHPLRLFSKNMDKASDITGENNTIVRPTFSYMGDYEISDNAIAQMAAHEATQSESIFRVNSINIRKTVHGIHMDMVVIMNFGCNINSVCRKVQYRIQKRVEEYTSINVRRVHIYVKGMKK